MLFNLLCYNESDRRCAYADFACVRRNKNGAVNTLSNGGSFTAIDENTIDGALFSKQNLTLNGAGILTVTSPAGHGIVCKDAGETYSITVGSQSGSFQAS